MEHPTSSLTLIPPVPGSPVLMASVRRPETVSALSTAAGIVLDTDIDVDVDVDAENKLNLCLTSHLSRLVNVSRCGNNFPASADRVAWDPPWC